MRISGIRGALVPAALACFGYAVLTLFFCENLLFIEVNVVYELTKQILFLILRRSAVISWRDNCSVYFRFGTFAFLLAAHSAAILLFL